MSKFALDHGKLTFDGLSGADNTSRERKSRYKSRKPTKPQNSFKIDLWEFVKSVSEYLKEEKIYLVKVAVEVLGIKMMSDFLDEVDEIEQNGGQMTADGKRRRTPGGVLWNLLKTRLEPQLYKQIMSEASGGKRKKKRRRGGDSSMRDEDDQDVPMRDADDHEDEEDVQMRDADDQPRRRRKRRKMNRMEVESDQPQPRPGEQPQHSDLDACPPALLPTPAAVARRTVDYSDL